MKVQSVDGIFIGSKESKKKEWHINKHFILQYGDKEVDIYPHKVYYNYSEGMERVD